MTKERLNKEYGIYHTDNQESILNAIEMIKDIAKVYEITLKAAYDKYFTNSSLGSLSKSIIEKELGVEGKLLSVV